MLNFFFCFLTAFLIAFAAMPSIIRIANRLSLFDEPNERKTHLKPIPLLGGIAVFAGALFSFTIWASPFFESQQLFIIAALILIFFFGLRDDIAPLAPVKKLFGQVLASLIVILYCNVRIEDMHGIFGLHSLSMTVSVLLTLFSMLFIINAYNLIDGIDGLSSGLGILSTFIFGMLFFAYEEFLMSMLSFALCGALSGFIPYNFHKAKIFLGDTGTMTIGFVIALIAIHFLNVAKSDSHAYLFSYSMAPALVLSVLIIPVIDMLRVFIIRLARFRSPLSADRNHIHHRMLELGLSTKETCMVLFAVNLVFVTATWFLRKYEPTSVFYFLIAGGLLLTQFPQLMIILKRNHSSIKV